MATIKPTAIKQKEPARRIKTAYGQYLAAQNVFIKQLSV